MMFWGCGAMGKSLGIIIKYVAAVGVNLIPGVGQALSAALVASATADVIGLGASLLGLGPSAPKPDTALTAIKTPRPPRVSGYGVGRLYGASVLFETAPS